MEVQPRRCRLPMTLVELAIWNFNCWDRNNRGSMMEKNELAIGTTQLGSEAIASRRAGRFWGSIVVAFLAGQILLGVTAFMLANNDPTVAVVPGYHERASLWDNSAELRQQSRELGWTVKYEQSSAGQGSTLRCGCTMVSGQPEPLAKRPFQS